MLIYIGATILTTCLSLASAQFGDGNANEFVDQVVIKTIYEIHRVCAK